MVSRRVIVLKFGKAVLTSPGCFAEVSDFIIRRSLEYDGVVVVVSAIGNTTDELLSLARLVHPSPPRREQDMLISVGERISMALLAMALDLKGKSAISLTGSQAGIITTEDHSEARIINVNARRLESQVIDKGNIGVVAGFQGVSRKGEITTLGRGGSDTTAVALAVALQAERVEFYKDVPGIFSDDPKKNCHAKLYSALDYETAFKIVSQGNHQILHSRSITLAKKNRLPLAVISFTPLNSNVGTLICEPASAKREPVSPIYEDE